MNEKDYYQEKLFEIRSLMKTDLFKAKILLDEELKMPYIPLKYEAEFFQLADENRRQLSVQMSKKTLTDEDVLEYLWSKDDLKEAIVLDYLKESNLRKYKDELKKWIETKPKAKNISKAYIFELLASQEISIDITLNKEVINPAKDGSIFDNKEVAKAFKEIEKLSAKEPSLEKIAVEEVERYLLSSFPKKVNDGKKLGTMIYNIVKNLIDGQTELSKEEERLLKEFK